MLIHPTDPRCYLLEIGDLEREPPPDVLRENRQAIEQVVAWAQQYLCQPHPDLGRPGPVCPFVQSSMKKCIFYMTVYRGANLDADEVFAAVMKYRDWFFHLEPREHKDAQYKSIQILFPDISVDEARRVIDGTQALLKPQYVERGIMVGEFHPGPPQKAGLWNADFRPLHCPVPLLSIRYMVATDYAFLKDDKQFMAAYLANFGHNVPSHLKESVMHSAQQFGLSDAVAESKPLSVLLQRGVPYTVRRHSEMPVPIASPHDFARALGYDLGRITKTLLLRDVRERRYAIAVCSAERRLDLQRLAAPMDSTRVQMATREELQDVVGQAPTGVSPIGVDGVPVFMDEALMRYETVLVGGGLPGVEVEIAPAELRDLTRAVVLPLVVPPRPGDEHARPATGVAE